MQNTNHSWHLLTTKAKAHKMKLVSTAGEKLYCLKMIFKQSSLIKVKLCILIGPYHGKHNFTYFEKKTF